MDKFFQFSQKVDSSKFFKALGIYFSNATTLFIEGTSIAMDVMKFYKENLEEGEYLPPAGTIFPKSTKLRCKFSLNFVNELSSVAEHYAEPELLDHVHVYKDDKPLLIWMDAFSDTIYISKEIPKDTIDHFLVDIRS